MAQVYSENQMRWIHFDPSENVFDAPLMYECGWNRTIDYVFGFSRHDVQDVTWRYSSRHLDLFLRRSFCSEDELVSVIFTLCKKRQKDLGEAAKQLLIERCFVELLQLLKER